MQLLLPALTLPAARPLIPLEAAMVLLDRDEDDVLAAIESGALAWAWDIRAPAAERRELRVWRDALLAVIAGRPAPDLGEAVVLEQILPQRDLRTTELQRLWSCSSTHLQALITAGELAAAAPRLAATGPNAFTRLRRDSVAAFLRRRRAGAAGAPPEFPRRGEDAARQGAQISARV